jgi:hypothetical protein
MVMRSECDSQKRLMTHRGGAAAEARSSLRNGTDNNLAHVDLGRLLDQRSRKVRSGNAAVRQALAVRFREPARD